MLNQVEIGVAPSQFPSAAGRNHRAPAKRVVGCLNFKKEFNELKLSKNKKKLSRITLILS